MAVIQKLYELRPDNVSSDDSVAMNTEFLHGIRNHEHFPLLIENLEKILVTELPPTTSTALFYELASLGVNLKTPIMNKLYVKVQNNFNEINLNELIQFISGLYNCSQDELEPIRFEYFSPVHVVISRKFRTIFSRYKSLVDEANTPEDIEKIGFLTNFLGGFLSEEKLEYFFQKYYQMIQDGILDPSKAR